MLRLLSMRDLLKSRSSAVSKMRMPIDVGLVVLRQKLIDSTGEFMEIGIRQVGNVVDLATSVLRGEVQHFVRE